ncbi:MAG: hypothetical protein ACXVFT_09345 [Solirubrobacteraceae bacterium]
MSATGTSRGDGADVPAPGGARPPAEPALAVRLPGVRCETCNTHWHPRRSALMLVAGTTCPRCRARLR